MTEQFRFKNVPEGHGEKFKAAVEAAVEAVVREQALKELEGLGISVPKSIMEGKQGERTYLDQYVELHARMLKMAQEIKTARDGKASEGVIQERDEVWGQQLGLIEQMRPSIFTSEQDQRFKDALKTWNMKQRSAFENQRLAGAILR